METSQVKCWWRLSSRDATLVVKTIQILDYLDFEFLIKIHNLHVHFNKVKYINFYLNLQ